MKIVFTLLVLCSSLSYSMDLIKSYDLLPYDLLPKTEKSIAQEARKSREREKGKSWQRNEKAATVALQEATYKEYIKTNTDYLDAIKNNSEICKKKMELPLRFIRRKK